MLNGFYLIWPFILQKSTTTHIRVDFFLSKLSAKRIKGAELYRWFKKVHNPCRTLVLEFQGGTEIIEAYQISKKVQITLPYSTI